MLTIDAVHLQGEQSSCTTALRFDELEQRILPLGVIAIIGILIGLLLP